MKLIFLLLTLKYFVFACGGTCLECHPKLQPLITDKEHTVLNQCVTCHDKPAQHGGACGQDCFSCHDKGKLYSDASVKEHQAIRECYSCHKDNADLLINKNVNKSVSSPSKLSPLSELFK